MHSINLSKANNGYVVSHYGNEKETQMVAKDLDEAMKMMKEMMEKTHKGEKKENFAKVKEKANGMAMKK